MKMKMYIELDDSVKKNDFFQKIKSFYLTKTQIFKYGIHKEEVPEFIPEDSFEYLESKIPALADLNEVWIELEKGKIINLASDEKAKEISEIIGVGAGLLYITKLLSVNPNRIARIKHPEEKKKILDFSINKKVNKYEIETKGTSYTGRISQMKEDIKRKKEANKNASIQIGTIALSRKRNDTGNSKLIVMDDYNTDFLESDLSIVDIINNYLWILSFVLDSSYYNRLVKNIKKKDLGKILIPKEKILSEYLYKDKKYVGYYFDKRLILERIKEYVEGSNNLTSLFQSVTKYIGKEKYFLGMDETVIDLINKKDLAAILAYESIQQIIEKENRYIFIDYDGIILVKSKGRGDKQIERRFSEKEVKHRLGLEFEFTRRNAHECGAPCRSREIEGKPCAILTYRDYCHFHR